MFPAMLTGAVSYDDTGVDFRYWTDGRLFNLRRLQANPRVKEDIAHDFLFVDDCALNASTQFWHAGKYGPFRHSLRRLWSHHKHQEDRGDASTSSWRLIHRANHHHQRGNIQGDWELCAPWKYLVTLCRHHLGGHLPISQSQLSLRQNCWTFRVGEKRSGLKKKIKVYLAVVLPSLLYACETWTVYSRHARQLNSFPLSAVSETYI